MGYPRGYWQGIEGLQRAREEAREFSRKEGRSPGPKELPAGIQGAILRENYNKLTKKTILSWNEFLEYCKLEKRPVRENWIGSKGFKKVEKIVNKWFKETGKSPTAHDLPAAIKRNIYAGLYAQFGVNGWNDLLRRCKLPLNFEHGIRKGEKGLLRAQGEIREFYRKNGRMPEPKEMWGVYVAVKHAKTWEEQEVNSWEELKELSAIL